MKRKILLITTLVFIFFCIVGFDPRLEVTYYDYSNPKVPASFDNFRIVHISDLHLKNFGSNQSRLLEAIMDYQPDIIVMTGDIVDENHDSLAPLENLLKGISSIPTYYVSGNHELLPEASSQYQTMLDLFSQYGVVNLDDQTETILRENSSIYITGSRWRSKYVVNYLPNADENYFNILLYHGTDFFPELASFHYDLILSGHVHGGIVRLPFIGGLFSNNGTLFPEYDAGIFSSNYTTMISSRGLGDSHIPRFYNRPELVCITLHTK